MRAQAVSRADGMIMVWDDPPGDPRDYAMIINSNHGPTQ
jgi:hypothetical protein